MMTGDIRNQIRISLNREKRGVSCAELQRLLIEEMMRFYDNNKTHAALALGISVKTLRNKLKRYQNGKEAT